MNQEEFRNLVKQLEDMAVLGKKDSSDTLVTELTQIQNRINNLQDCLAEFKTISEDAYANEGARLQDQSLAIKIKEKVRALKTDLKEIQGKIDIETAKEKSQAHSIDETKQSLTISKDGILSMQKRSEMLSDEIIKAQYKEKIATLEETISDLKTSLDELETDYGKTQSSIEDLVKKREQIEKNIVTENGNLDELQATIDDGNAYIDKKRKESDEKTIANLEAEIAKLETRKNEIVDNPSLIANQAIEAFVSGDIPTALKKLKRVEEKAVEKNPYINEPNRDSLKDALVGAEEARDTFYQSIADRKYTDGNTTSIDARIAYLENSINIWKEDISKRNAKSNALDKDEVYNTDAELTKVQADITRITEELKEYKSLLEGINEEDISKKAEIQAAYDKKEKELSFAKRLRDSYNGDRLESIKEITSLEEYNKLVQEKIVKAESEKQTLSKEKALTNGTKDILAKQADDKKLQELVDNVMKLKHAMKFSEPVSAVMKKIESELGLSMNSDTQNEEVKSEMETAPLEEVQPTELQTEVEEIKEEQVKTNEIEQANEATEVKEDIALEQQKIEKSKEIVNNIATETTSPEVENIEPKQEVKEEEKSSDIVFEPVSFDDINTTFESEKKPEESGLDIKDTKESLVENNQIPATETLQTIETELNNQEPLKTTTKVVEQEPISLDNTPKESFDGMQAVKEETPVSTQETKDTLVDLSDFFKQLYPQSEMENSEETSLRLGA